MQALSARRVLSAICVCLVLSVLSGIAGTRGQTRGPLPMCNPSAGKTQIAFSFAGSIWIAGRNGDNLCRLTSGSHEAGPVLSPDDSEVAFAGEYDGTGTGGGLVGGHGFPDDGGLATTLKLAFCNPCGAWHWENHGVAPDIEVENDPKAEREGRHPRRERGIAVLLDCVQNNTASAPQDPTCPNYQKSDA